jgi:hypothetical protein
VLIVLALGAEISWCAGPSHKPALQFDLTQFGYLKQKDGGPADYTTIGFLSEDLVLVAINQRFFHGVDPLFSDTPDSTVIVFDIVKRQAIRVAHMPLFKNSHAVAPVLNNHFLVLTLAEVKLCSIDVQCYRSFPTRGPLWVSWKRDKVVVGGNLRTPRFLLDSRTLTPVEDPNQDAVRIPTEQSPRFSPDRHTLIWSADGERLMTSEEGYTSWNKLMNPLGGLGERPFNWRQVTVYDQQQRNELFRLHWDPRPGWPSDDPAISPTGHRIAVNIRGMLEVFDVP